MSMVVCAVTPLRAEISVMSGLSCWLISDMPCNIRHNPWCYPGVVCVLDKLFMHRIPS